MSILGKLHEISFYGLLANIYCLYRQYISIQYEKSIAFAPKAIHSFSEGFVFYLAWASIMFIPIAILGAFQTKYSDGGEGLTFQSDMIIVILFAHIAEEILGLFLTPAWLIKDLLTRNFDNSDKILDYITYAIELVVILAGITILYRRSIM